MTTYQIKRIYEPASDNDGYRVLVDRLWPRGISKQKAALGKWCKDIAPSDDLRTWFNHDPERFDAFRRKYTAELDASKPVVEELRHQVAGQAVVTLLYGAHDEEHNQAVVLQFYLQK